MGTGVTVGGTGVAAVGGDVAVDETGVVKDSAAGVEGAGNTATALSSRVRRAVNATISRTAATAPTATNSHRKFR
jgi:hypothetical protein